MKTIYILQMYILKELLKTLCLSLVVVTSILFMAMLLQLVSKLQVIDITNFVDFLPNLVLYILGYTLPLSLLVSTNLTWGKFSSDNEITAMKACGISPLHLLSPFLFVSLYISLISYYLNDQIIPQSHLQKRQLMHHAIHQILNSTASHGGATIELINDLRISYFRYKDGVFHGLLIHRLDNGQAQEKWVGAQGKMFFDGQSLILKLKKGSFQKIDPLYPKNRLSSSFESMDFPIAIDKYEKNYDRLNRPKYRTLLQLVLYDVEDSERELKEARQHLQDFLDGKSADARQLADLEPADYNAKKNERQEYLKYVLKNAQKRYYQVFLEIHQRRAFSMASFFWIFIGIGMSLLTRHRVLSFGVSAILVTVLYYPFLMFGEWLVMRGYPPIPSMWMANGITGVVGFLLMFKALRH